MDGVFSPACYIHTNFTSRHPKIKVRAVKVPAAPKNSNEFVAEMSRGRVAPETLNPKP